MMKHFENYKNLILLAIHDLENNFLSDTHSFL